MNPEPYCPNPAKTRYANGVEAADALARIQRTPTLADAPGKPTHIYECRGGHWHLTSHMRREAGEHRPEDNVPTDKLPAHEQRIQRALKILSMIEDAEAQGGRAELVHPGGVRQRLHVA